MKFDRTKFFENYRARFGSLVQIQVDGLNRLLTGFENYYGWWDSIPQMANALAQVKIETAHSFQPVVEGYYLGDKTRPGYYKGNTDRVKRHQRSLRYYPHIGMGDIQLTWAANYADQDEKVRMYFPEVVDDFEKRTGQKFNLITQPEQVLDDQISFCVMTIGMHLGTFRPRHTLDRYINDRVADHFNARDIVNGDKRKLMDNGMKLGDVIARDAKKFELCLNASLITFAEDVPATAEPRPDPQSEPLPEIPAVGTPTNSAVELQAEASFQPKNFNAFVPQIDTAKAWITRATAGTTIGGALAVAFGLPEWLQIGLFGLLVIIVIGAIVIFVKYHKQIFTYVTGMNTLRAEENTNNPVIVGKPPTD